MKGWLAPAVRGNLVDMSHPVVRQKLEKTDSPKTKPGPKTKLKLRENGTTREANGSVAYIPDHVAEYMDLPFRDLVAMFGTDAVFAKWLKAAKDIEYLREKSLKNDKEEGKLVDRSLVDKAVIHNIEGFFVRLLGETTKTCAMEAVEAVKGGAEWPEVQNLINDRVGSLISTTKNTISRALKSDE